MICRKFWRTVPKVQSSVFVSNVWAMEQGLGDKYDLKKKRFNTKNVSLSKAKINEENCIHSTNGKISVLLLISLSLFDTTGHSPF